MLAHDLTVLGVPVDLGRLYDSPDRLYLTWLTGVVEKVHETKREEAKAAERSAKGR